MGDLLKEPNLFGENHSRLTIDLENYLVEGLRIPLDHLHYWSHVPNFDAYYIHTVNGLKFAVSGPEVHGWIHENEG